MRNFLPLLLALTLSPTFAQTVATYNFEQGLDGWTSPTPAQLTRETDHPLLGAGSLRLTLPDKTPEVHAVSPPFPVSPWTLYRLRLRQNTDLGAELGVSLELNSGSGGTGVSPVSPWLPASFYSFPDSGGAGLFGTFPDSTQARLTLTLRVPGQALGRSSVVDEIRLTQESPLVKATGPNLYWDGGFEQSTNDMSNWGEAPKKMEASTDRPRSGLRCLHVESDKWTYVVFPSVPVQPLRLYHFRCWVRGTGAVYPGLHKIGTQDYASIMTNIMPRVGYAAPPVSEVRLQPDEWQPIDIETPCESDRILWFNVFLTFPGGKLDIDDAELTSVP